VGEFGNDNGKQRKKKPPITLSQRNRERESTCHKLKQSMPSKGKSDREKGTRPLPNKDAWRKKSAPAQPMSNDAISPIWRFITMTGVKSRSARRGRIHSKESAEKISGKKKPQLTRSPAWKRVENRITKNRKKRVEIQGKRERKTALPEKMWFRGKKELVLNGSIRRGRLAVGCDTTGRPFSARPGP